MKKLIGLVFCGTALIQTSCVTRGDDFSSDYQWIQEGKTSKQEVSRRLGEPFHVGYSGGRPTWTYGYYHFRLIGQSHTKELTFYWDNQDRVDAFNFKSSFPEDRQRALNSPKPKLMD